MHNTRLSFLKLTIVVPSVLHNFVKQDNEIAKGDENVRKVCYLKIRSVYCSYFIGEKFISNDDSFF